MTRAIQNVGFTCMKCGERVLFSKHVDEKPGDRNNPCSGLMEPIGLRFNSQKGYQVVHRCTQCGENQANRTAQDTVQPDNIEALMSVGPVVSDCSLYAYNAH